MPGKQGGFFRRLQKKQQRQSGKRTRGSQGLSTEDRRAKHNALVDEQRDRRRRELEREMLPPPSSASSDDGSDDHSDAVAGDESLAKLRLSLFGPTVALPSGQRLDGVDTDPAKHTTALPADNDVTGDNPLLEEDLSLLGESTSADSLSQSMASDEEPRATSAKSEDDELLRCAKCNVELGDAEDGFACRTCRKVFCETCLAATHRGDRRAAHDIVSMAAIDEMESDEDDGERTDGSNPDPVESADERDEGGSVSREDDDAESDREELFRQDANDDDENDETHDNNRHAHKVRGGGQEDFDGSEANELHRLLPRFDMAVTPEDLAAVVGLHKHDPWFEKYHRDAHGAPDRTELVALEGEELQSFTRQTPTGKQRQETTRPTLFLGRVTKATQRWIKRATALVQRRLLAMPGPSSVDGLIPSSSRPALVHPWVWALWTGYSNRLQHPLFSQDEWSLFATLTTYADVQSSRRDAVANGDRYMSLVVLHVLNHMAKTKTICLANDRKQARLESKEEGRAGDNDNDDDGDGADTANFELRDRGFGRTRVLVVLPMRNIAHRYVHRFCEILGLEDPVSVSSHAASASPQTPARPNSVKKLDVFDKDFTELEEVVDKSFKRRPPDYRRQFAGNINDSFCFGLSLKVWARQLLVGASPDAAAQLTDTSRSNAPELSIYSHVLNSDILVCSPLGLRKRLHKDANVLVSLSSIEICVLDEAHVLMMQNWQHVQFLMRLLNTRPTETTEGLNDLRRVYRFALDGKFKRHRQTVVLSDLDHALVNALVRSGCNNSGRVSLTLNPALQSGVLAQLSCTLRHSFIRFPATSVATIDDERFQYFANRIFPARIQPLVERQVRTIIYVPSYFDFIRVREFLFQQIRGSFDVLSEDTSLKDQRRALVSFTDLERPLLVVTERFYFFKRYFVQLAEVIINYAPPTFPLFYNAMVTKLQHGSAHAQALTLFCRYDAFEVGRIVGAKRSQMVLTRDTDAFVFVTSGLATA